MKSAYAASIREALAALGLIGTSPAHIEAHMRAENGGTIDHLSPQKFRAAVAEAVEFAAGMTSEENERLAESYGLEGGAA